MSKEKRKAPVSERPSKVPSQYG